MSAQIFIDDYELTGKCKFFDECPLHTWAVQNDACYIGLHPSEQFSLRANQSENQDLTKHLSDARDTKSVLNLRLILDDKILGNYSTVIEYLLFDFTILGTFTLALRIKQEICKNDVGEICFRAEKFCV